MTIVERALELVSGHTLIGLGSGRAAQAFIRSLGEQVRSGALPLEIQGAGIGKGFRHGIVKLRCLKWLGASSATGHEHLPIVE